jgi:hypothetical protein
LTDPKNPDGIRVSSPFFGRCCLGLLTRTLAALSVEESNLSPALRFTPYSQPWHRD